LYVTRKKAFVQKTRAKNARENVGEIDPWSLAGVEIRLTKKNETLAMSKNKQAKNED